MDPIGFMVLCFFGLYDPLHSHLGPTKVGPLLCGSHLIDGGSLDVPWAHHWDGRVVICQAGPTEKGVETP